MLQAQAIDGWTLSDFEHTDPVLFQDTSINMSKFERLLADILKFLHQNLIKFFRYLSYLINQ